MDLGFTNVKNLCGKKANAYGSLLMKKHIPNQFMEIVQAD